MYIPVINEMNDHDEVLAFIKEHSFATIITNGGGVPIASHLPMVIEEEMDSLKIIGHFAKANSHWQLLNNQKSLIIFAEPHAYISPVHYESIVNVPTWNYIAVHVYGDCTLVTDDASSIAILEKTIGTYEAEYKKQWDALPADYKKANLNGIVCFEMKVTDIQAKKKLSQNKTSNERQSIIRQLEKSSNTLEVKIAGLMQKEIEK